MINERQIPLGMKSRQKGDVEQKKNPVRDSMLPYVFLNRLLCKGFEKEMGQGDLGESEVELTEKEK